MAWCFYLGVLVDWDWVSGWNESDPGSGCDGDHLKDLDDHGDVWGQAWVVVDLWDTVIRHNVEQVNLVKLLLQVTDQRDVACAETGQYISRSEILCQKQMW